MLPPTFREDRWRAFSLAFLAVLLLAAPGLAQKQEKKQSRYENLKLSLFQVKDGVNLPPDFLATFEKELTEQLAKTHKFKQVLAPGETPTDPAAPTLMMTGELTEYKPGSRAKRYFVGFGAGAASGVAHVKLTDDATGEVIFVGDITGKVVAGVAGGSANSMAKVLAKEIARVVKKQSL